MKNDEIKLFNDYSNISENQKNAFFSNIQSDFNYKVNFFKCEYDFSWLDVMEDTLKYLQNIVKEPKVFIKNNEEIVQIEKSKKVSVESVVHLTQHSSFVSKFDNRTGEIRPSKILNVIREETMDIYENRFIFTLINNMTEFIENYGVLALENNDSKNSRTLSYNAQTKNNNELININLNIDSVEDKSIENIGRKAKLNARIEHVRDEINSLRNSNFYKNMKSLNVPVVKSPIKKTNVILKNPNFQRAEYLWHFLESYDKEVKRESKYLKNYSNNREIEQKLNTSFLLNYAIFETTKIDEDINDDDELNLNYLKHSIEEFLNRDTFISEDKFLKLMKNEYNKIRKKQEKEYKEMREIIEDDLNEYKKEVDLIRTNLKNNTYLNKLKKPKLKSI